MAIIQALSRPKIKRATSWLFSDKSLDWLAIIFILAFLVSGILSLPKYGLTWDEGLGNLFFGERYFKYLTTFQDKFLDFRADLAATRKLPLDLFQSPLREHPYTYPPLADTLSAASMYLFSYQLHWLDPVDGFHLFKVLLAAVFLWFFYRFASRHMGRSGAFLGLICLGTFPRFWGDMHFNPKDVPEMIFFGLCVMAYFKWYERPRWYWAVVSGLLLGAGLAIKANAVFVPLVLILGVWPWGIKPQSWLEVLRYQLRYAGHYILMAISCAGLYFISWPLMYTNPAIARTYFTLMAGQDSRTGPPGWSWNPFGFVATMMPEVVLLFFAIGVFFVVRQALREKSTFWRLLLVWCYLPIIRISLPGQVNFDGIRHFMEFLPPAMLIAGYGVTSLVDRLGRNRIVLKSALGAGVVMLLAANISDIYIRYYPYEYLYYNRLAGGLSGAQQLFGKSETTDYWASSYREGLQWINENVEPDASLGVPVANWLVQITRRIWVRPDINLLPARPDDKELKSGKPVYIMFITRPEFYTELATYCASHLTPVHQIVVDGVPVLVIYRWN
jgi:hypothetical protein